MIDDRLRPRLFVNVLSALLLTALAAGGAAKDANTPSPAPQSAPKVGDVIPGFSTVSVAGEARQISFPKGKKTVLLFFLSSCPACHKMIPEWNRSYAAKPADLEVIGVVLDQPPPGFLATMQIPFPVVRPPDREFLRRLNINRVPLALRVGAEGKVEDVAMGPVDPIRLGELFRP